jgi:hypothetical protein
MIFLDRCSTCTLLLHQCIDASSCNQERMFDEQNSQSHSIPFTIYISAAEQELF